MQRQLHLLCVLVLLLSFTSSHATTIDFSSDFTGTFFDGFRSVDAPDVLFLPLVGRTLTVSGLSGAPAPALVSFAGGVLIEFDNIADSLAMDFGNDELGSLGSLGDLAVLQVYLDGNLVGTSSLAMNFNDLIDQTISIAGVAFDSAIIDYTTPAGDPIQLARLIDNIVFDVAVVPIPASVWLFGSGLLGLVGMARRKKAA
jgi:hypothetical protein